MRHAGDGYAQQESNSRTLLKYALGLLKEKAETKLIDISDYPINQCRQCYSTSENLCHYPCDCYDDPINDIVLPEIGSADGIIFASPTFNGNMPPILSALFSRMLCMEEFEGTKDPLVAKVGACIVTCHEDGAMATANSILNNCMEYSFIIPPASIVYHKSSNQRSTIFNKEALAQDFLVLKNISMMIIDVYNMCNLIKNSDIKWGKYEYSRYPASDAEKHKTFRYNQEFMRYLEFIGKIDDDDQ